MSVLEITVQPTATDPDAVLASHFVTSMLLEGRRWTFDFYTNTSDGTWYHDLRDDADAYVYQGVALANGTDLFYLYRYKGTPPGVLFIQDQGLNGSDPGIDSFADKTAALYYLTSDEL